MIPDTSRRDLELFARGSAERVPSGHAAGMVVAVYDGRTVIDFGDVLAWFRSADFPDVGVNDFVTVGPAVARWGITIKGER